MFGKCFASLSLQSAAKTVAVILIIDENMSCLKTDKLLVTNPFTKIIRNQPYILKWSFPCHLECEHTLTILHIWCFLWLYLFPIISLWEELTQHYRQDKRFLLCYHYDRETLIGTLQCITSSVCVESCPKYVTQLQGNYHELGLVKLMRLDTTSSSHYFHSTSAKRKKKKT